MRKRIDPRRRKFQFSNYYNNRRADDRVNLGAGVKNLSTVAIARTLSAGCGILHDFIVNRHLVIAPPVTNFWIRVRFSLHTRGLSRLSRRVRAAAFRMLQFFIYRLVLLLNLFYPECPARIQLKFSLNPRLDPRYSPCPRDELEVDLFCIIVGVCMWIYSRFIYLGYRHARAHIHTRLEVILETLSRLSFLIDSL